MKNKNKSGEHHKKMMELHQRMIELEKLEIKIERKKKSIHEVEKKTLELFDHDKKGISIVQNTIIKYANPYVSGLVGRSPEEVINTSFFNYVCPEEIPKVAKYYVGRLTGDKDTPVIYKTKIKHREGKIIDIEVTASRIKYKGSPADFVVISEISKKEK